MSNRRRRRRREKKKKKKKKNQSFLAIMTYKLNSNKIYFSGRKIARREPVIHIMIKTGALLESLVFHQLNIIFLTNN